jgi:tryptophanyl-tRNA synthetase
VKINVNTWSFLGRFLSLSLSLSDHFFLPQSNLAASFNRHVGSEFFPLPNSVPSTFPRVMSLTNAEKKMSKSDPSKWSCLFLTDTDDEIHTKITKAKTDSIGHVTPDMESRPEVSNLLRLYASFSGTKDEETV